MINRQRHYFLQEKKMMRFSTVGFALFMVGINMTSFAKEEQKGIHVYYRAIDVSDMLAKSRSKRAVIGYGVLIARRAAKAVEKLLSRATEVESGRIFSRHFETKGNYHQTKKDFKSLQPSDVKPYISPGGFVGKEGKAGDMTIMIGNKDELGKPYMKIFYGTPFQRFDKIIYMD